MVGRGERRGERAEGGERKTGRESNTWSLGDQRLPMSLLIHLCFLTLITILGEGGWGVSIVLCSNVQ